MTNGYLVVKDREGSEVKKKDRLGLRLIFFTFTIDKRHRKTSTDCD